MGTRVVRCDAVLAVLLLFWSDRWWYVRLDVVWNNFIQVMSRARGALSALSGSSTLVLGQLSQSASLIAMKHARGSYEVATRYEATSNDSRR